MSAVDLKPLRRAHILIVDDDKREGQRLAKQLRDISSEISCIGAATDPVRFTPDAEGLIVKLREALQALGEGREEIFLECALDIPKVIVLDEFLRDPSGSEDPSASRAVKRLIGQIWSKKSKAESVVVRGWSCCVLMYTHLKDLVAFDTEDAEIRGKPWIDFRTKKPVPKSPAEAAEERAAWRDAINALTSLPALTRATYVDLFFGPKGSALIQAIDEAERNTAKPVWVAGRESDGASQVLCCVMNLAPRILVHSQDGFEAWLNQISRARAAPGDAAIALSGEGLTDTERVGATLVRCAPIKFHVWAEWLPPTELRDLFSVVELRPLFEWSLDEIRGLFTARFHRPIRDEVIVALKRCQVTYFELMGLRFLPEEAVSWGQIKRKLRRLSAGEVTLRWARDHWELEFNGETKRLEEGAQADEFLIYLLEAMSRGMQTNGAIRVDLHDVNIPPKSSISQSYLAATAKDMFWHNRRTAINRILQSLDSGPDIDPDGPLRLKVQQLKEGRHQFRFSLGGARKVKFIGMSSATQPTHNPR